MAVLQFILGSSEFQVVSLTGSLSEKEALRCIERSSNASYWKVSYSLKTPLKQVYLLCLGQLDLVTKEQVAFLK